MKAESIKAKKKGHYHIVYQGLRSITYHALMRGGYGNGEYPDKTLNIARIREDVLSGKILEVRNLGRGILKEICEWLE